jgi:hypothetical protein
MAKIRHRKIRSAQIRALQKRTLQIHASKIGVLEIYTAQIRFGPAFATGLDPDSVLVENRSKLKQPPALRGLGSLGGFSAFVGIDVGVLDGCKFSMCTFGLGWLGLRALGLNGVHFARGRIVERSLFV